MNNEVETREETGKKLDEIINSRIDVLLKKYSVDEHVLNDYINRIYECTFDDVIYTLILQTHRAAKFGFLFLSDTEDEQESDHEYDITNEKDIFEINSTTSQSQTATTSSKSNSSNNNLSKYECKCPSCNRTIGATRFAPHLEKCMGLGRNSSRVASRRIATYNIDDYDQFFDDEITQHSASIASSSSSSNLFDLESSNAATTTTTTGILAATATHSTNINQKPAKRKRLQASASMQNLASTTNK